MTLWRYLKEKMMFSLEQSIYEDEEKFTYKKLVIYAEDYAKKLKGVKCCAILCESELYAAFALLSCFAAGVTAIPTSRRYGELHCNKIMDMISPDAIIDDDGGYLNVTKICSSKFREPQIHPALIMCTSGTTGIPKGVMLTEENIITNVNDISEYFEIGKEDTILISRPLYHCAVLTGEFLVSLVKGVKIRFCSEKLNPAHLIEIMRKEKITVFCGTPTIMGFICRLLSKENAPGLKHICISGECLDKKTGLKVKEAFLSANIYHVYGLTEACPRVSYLPVYLFEKYTECVGIPLRNVSIKILSACGKECSYGEIGILYVRGNNVMSGYYNDVEKTSKVLQDGWLCTGDMACINEEGLLEIKGRSDDMIIKGGLNIYPGEIEAALKTDAHVEEVLVYGYSTDYGICIGMKISGEFSSVYDVKKICSECLPEYQIPTRIELVDKLLKNSSGKVIRNK